MPKLTLTYFNIIKDSGEHFRSSSFKENYNFLRFQRGSSNYQGRGITTFSRGGGGGGPDPLYPSGSAHDSPNFQVLSKANPERQVSSCNGSFSIA